MTASMTNYEAVLENELPRVMHEVLFAMFGEQSATDVLVSTPLDYPMAVACRVRIRGASDYEVIVSATLDLANRIAAHMFEADLKERGATAPTPREARDALREVANIVAGNLKPVLGDNNQLGLPEDLAENMTQMHADPLAHATLEHDAGALDVVVYTSL